MKAKYINSVLKTITIACTCIFSIFCIGQNYSDTAIIKSHLIKITKTDTFRNYQNFEQLNKTADYIYAQLNQYADTTYFQEYQVVGQTYKNVICQFGLKNKKKIVIGAHYDVCGNQEGADDNGTGVVGLMELARLLKGKQLNYCIEIVAYTLEEPPFFNTHKMGSYVHAKSLVDKHESVYGMISLEMIGYFDPSKKSQTYPVGILSWVYGNKGNYITLVKKFGAGVFARKFCRNYRSNNSLKTKIFTGPKLLPGIDFSDHKNYWEFGYSALMITDTAFYRNKNYHENSDVLETLDLCKIAQVINDVLNTICAL